MSIDRAGKLAKIDQADSKGLAAGHNSLAYRAGEIDRHVHAREHWVGIHGAVDATHWGGDTLTPFVAISGAAAYGAGANDEAFVLGSADTPAFTGDVYFDVHQMAVVASNSTSPWKLRLIWGTGTMAQAIIDEQFTETMVTVASQAGRLGTAAIRMRRVAVGTQVWVQAKNATDNATISLFVGLHSYEG